MSNRLLRALAAAVLVLSMGWDARADDQTDLAKARAAYEARNYEDADRRLHDMLDPATGTLKDPTLRAQARMYWGATLLALKKPADANAMFEKLLLDEPTFEPDPLSFPSNVIDAFFDTRKRIIDKINAAKAEQARLAAERRAREEEERRHAAEHLQKMEKLASEETITERHSRWVALLPFGIGQFQNGQTGLGWVFLTTEAVLLAGGVVAFPFWYYNRGRVNDLTGQDPNRDPLLTYRDRASAAAIANGIFNGAFAAVAIIGAIHAEATFVPEKKETRKRSIDARVTPVVAPQKGGGVFGLEARF